eukprot:5048756-Amphidinium_carterae.1
MRLHNKFLAIVHNCLCSDGTYARTKARHPGEVQVDTLYIGTFYDNESCQAFSCARTKNPKWVCWNVVTLYIGVPLITVLFKLESKSMCRSLKWNLVIPVMGSNRCRS